MDGQKHNEWPERDSQNPLVEAYASTVTLAAIKISPEVAALRHELRNVIRFMPLPVAHGLSPFGPRVIGCHQVN